MQNYIRKNWDKLLLFSLSCLLILPLLRPGYFSHHDDLHIIRIFEMRKCLVDLQIPCRWVPDMGYGYGFPLFNYYNPFAYYIGAFTSFIVGYIVSAKLLFLIPLLFAGYTMYLFVSQISNKKAALLSGILYAYAPYRSVDTYVRGAIGESFSLMIAPLVFYFSFKLVKEYKLSNFLGLSLSLAAFLISHNVSIIIWAPVILLWFVILFAQNRDNIKPVLTSVLLGFGLSAFFTVPAFLEKNLISTDGLTSFALDFRNHFVSYKQLFFEKTWGYGASVFGRADKLSFQIGFPHWILIGVTSILFLFSFKKVDRQKKLIFLFFISVFVFSAFMTHVRSVAIWESFKSFSFIQFPWRYLSLAIFSASVLGGFVFNFTKEKISQALLIALIVLTVVLNFSYFRPETYVLDMTDSKKLSGIELQNQMEGSILDYLPKTAKKPLRLAPEAPFVVSGEASFGKFSKKSSSWSFNAESLEESEITLPVLDFPTWKITDNGQRLEHKYDIDGYITLKLDKGSHLINGKFQNTPIRTLANSITLISIFGLVYLLKYGKSRKILG